MRLHRLGGLVVTAAALALAPAAAFAVQGPEGLWMMTGDAMKVRIAPCAGQAGQLCGTIAWLKPRQEDKAAVKPAANTPAPKSPVGYAIMTGFKPDGANRWKGKFLLGKGKTLNGTLSLNKDGSLHVSGCLLAICKGQDWKRTG